MNPQFWQQVKAAIKEGNADEVARLIGDDESKLTMTDKEKAGAAFRGLQQFDRGFLKTYLQLSQQKFKGLEGGDVRPLFEAAAQRGIEAEHRALATEVLTWLADK